MTRLAPITLAPMGCLLLFAFGSNAVSGEFFHKHASDGNAQVVQLPAQSVVVETTRPRVIVHERRTRAVRAESPFVATLFTPVNSPMAAGARSADSLSLSLAHQMEINMLQLERERKDNEDQLAYTQRVFERISRSMQAAAPAAPRADAASVSAQIQELSTRLGRLEELVLLHGDVLKKIAPKPAPAAPPMPMPEPAK